MKERLDSPIIDIADIITLINKMFAISELRKFGFGQIKNCFFIPVCQRFVRNVQSTCTQAPVDITVLYVMNERCNLLKLYT